MIEKETIAKRLEGEVSDLLSRFGRKIDSRYGKVVILYLGDKIEVQFASMLPGSSLTSFDWLWAREAGIEMPGTTFVLDRYQLGSLIVEKVRNIELPAYATVAA